MLDNFLAYERRLGASDICLYRRMNRMHVNNEMFLDIWGLTGNIRHIKKRKLNFLRLYEKKPD